VVSLRLLGDNMFEWIKNLLGKIPFTTEEVIRCKVCYLKATHELSLSAVDLETEQLEEMQIQICSNCLKDIKIKINVMKDEDERSS
tara:strand:+ start:854 stop:1111 length:258 start_codon:yes stop_codon:yes gene_type:complete